MVINGQNVRGGGLSLSLGRWAIGYNYAYVLARVLEETSPRRILECGLGQSSALIGAYVEANGDVMFDVVEQDASWAELCKKRFFNSERTQVFVRPIEQKEYKPGAGKTNVYQDFGNVVAGKKYSLISIDGPWGSDGVSRVDVLEHIPEILADDFVIMCDDCERSGERAMVKMLEEKLKASGIDFASSGFGYYKGEKDIAVIASKGFTFVTTM